jgi:serine/threonine protein kinase
MVMGVRADGTRSVRLTGFGLAKHMGEDDDDPTAITMTGQVIGNPAYMAPETIMMGILDPRTDLYTLGVTLYELVSGRRPFQGQSLAEMLAAHVQGTPDPIRQHRPDVDAPFERLVTRLLAKDPEVRYQSAADALAALRNDVSAWPAPPGGGFEAPVAPAKVRKSSIKNAKSGSGAKKVLLWVFVAVISAGTLGAGLGYLILWLKNGG